MKLSNYLSFVSVWLFCSRLVALTTVLFSINATAEAKLDMQYAIPAEHKTVDASKMVPYALSTIPDSVFGDKIKLGYQLITDSQKMRGKYVFDNQNCTNCHLASGRKPNAAPLGAAFFAYPAFRSKNNKVNSYQERIQGCFKYSMNGLLPPDGSDELIAIAAYSYWVGITSMYNYYEIKADVPEVSDADLLQGGNVDSFVLDKAIAGKMTVKERSKLPGRGYPKLAKPELAPNYAQGKIVYTDHCAACHKEDGQGRAVKGISSLPPLWGPNSYNLGAGMHRINTAAFYIYENMPIGKSIQLSNQEAWDVALYMNSQQRPQDPRFEGDVTKTDKVYHNHDCVYGDEINGSVLGKDAYPNHPKTK